MKKSLLTLSVTLVLTGGALSLAAQEGQGDQSQGQGQGRRGRRQMDPQQRVDMLAKRLNLSDNQKTQLLPVITDGQNQMKALFEDSSMTREDKMQKMQTIRQDTDTKINAILTDEQKQKYSKMQERMRERMMNRQGQGGGGEDKQ